jgi:glycosyltransferase involved in cell wall biosynthesis
MFYFSTEYSFAEQINIIDSLCNEEIVNKKYFAMQRIKEYYNWDRIINKYVKMFNAIYDKKQKHENINI